MPLDTDSPLVNPNPRPLSVEVRQRHVAILRSLPPGSAFSHATAAGLLGWPTPWFARVTGDIHIIRPTSSGRIRRPGIIGHVGLETRQLIDIEGMPVVAPADTWVDLGALTTPGHPYQIGDLIACGDQALNYLVTPEELGGIIEQRGYVRGKRNLLPALGYLRAGSESGPESRWRLIMACAGLPEPRLNKTIFDAHGTFFARPDYRWDAAHVAGEFQGEEWHDTPGAVAADTSRFTAGKHMGWHFIEVRRQHINERAARDEKLVEFAEALAFPVSRLDFDAAEPRRFSAHFLATLLENRERTRRRQRAQEWAQR